jgi:tRNA(Ile2) C34 agmatinyltransferase TiaS
MMDERKFKVGQKVRLVQRILYRTTPNAVYEITRAMPSDGREHSYRVKALHENHERAVSEGEIESAFGS